MHCDDVETIHGFVLFIFATLCMFCFGKGLLISLPHPLQTTDRLVAESSIPNPNISLGVNIIVSCVPERN